MQKTIAFFLLAFTVCSCSVYKKTDLSNVKGNANRSFIINSLNAVLSADDEEYHVLSYIKYSYPDKYFFSLRNKMGMEMMKVWVGVDSTFILNKLNRYFYYGKTDVILSKTGLCFDDLSLLFGDFSKVNDGSYLTKNFSDSNFVYFTRDKKINYKFEIKNKRCRSLLIDNRYRINYEENRKKYKCISLGDVRHNFNIDLKIKNIQYVDKVEIVFVKPKNFKNSPVR